MSKNWFVEPMKGEVLQEEIIEKGESGEFHEWEYQAFDTKEIGYEDVMETLKNYQKVYADAEGDKERQEEIVNEVLQIYRDRNVFPIQYYSEMGIIDEIEKCIAYKAAFDGDTVSCVSGDTEYFNGTDWVQISNYKEGDRVLQYNIDGTAELVKPIRYIHERGNFGAYEYDSYQLSSIQTADHDSVVVDDGTLACESIGTTNTGVKLGKSPQGIVAKCRSLFVKIPSGVTYEGERVLSEYDAKSVVSVVENSGSNYSTSLYNVSFESKRNLLMSMIDACGHYASEKTYIYEAKNDFNLKFAASLAFFAGYSVHSVVDGENVLVFSEDGYSTYSTWMFQKVTLGEKFCFEVPSHMLVLRHNGIPYITGNCGAGVGTTLCDFLFPNLYDTPSKHDINKTGAETLFAKFHNDEYLKRAIKFCFSYKDGRPVPTSVMGGLRLVGSAPTNFRPMNAKAVYERFCPKGGVIYDFAAGFGGRMLGALSSKNNYKYVATDPNVETMYHLHQLGDYIEEVTGREDSYELHCCGSEMFKGPANSIDFAFSSPPYFDLEVYSDDPTQCYNKFPVLEDWLEGYVRETIRNVIHMLKPGRCYAVNIADFKVGSNVMCAYVDEWVRISNEEGAPLFDTVYLGVTARAGSKEQAAGELKKENILIFKKPL